MKKILLSLGAAMLASGAFAAENVIAEMYPGSASLIGWGCDGLMEQPYTEDGRECVKIAQTAEGKQSWEVQFAFDAEGGYEIGTTYYFTFDVKGTPSAGIPSGFQCTDGWVGCGDLNTFAITEEWNTVTISGTVTDPGEGKSVQRWVASIGSYLGTFYISNMKLYTIVEGGEPSGAEVVAEYYTGNGATFGGWGGNSTFENVDEDGKPCLKFTNSTAQDNDWQIQACINYEFEAGETYSLDFDVKGDAYSGMGSFFQAARNYATAGNLTSFDVTSDWTHVTISGVAENGTEDADGINPPVRMLINLGWYVGSLYMTNVRLYKGVPAGVEAISTSNAVRTGVYTINGMRVADSENLLPGLYIIDGKKVLVK